MNSIFLIIFIIYTIIMPTSTYKDKTQEQIKTELKNEFDANGSFLVNDEKEIYQA